MGCKFFWDPIQPCNLAASLKTNTFVAVVSKRRRRVLTHPDAWTRLAIITTIQKPMTSRRTRLMQALVPIGRAGLSAITSLCVFINNWLMALVLSLHLDHPISFFHPALIQTEIHGSWQTLMAPSSNLSNKKTHCRNNSINCWLPTPSFCSITKPL